MDQINNIIKYSIIDKTFNNSTHIYNEHRYIDNYLEIKKNKQAIKEYFSANKAVFLYQIHSNKIIEATSNYDENKLIKADGIITKQKRILLVIQTADCVPILLFNEKNNIIGAAHCGWKGTKKNIIKNIINEMKDNGAKKISAIIGPSIQQKSYEVDNDYYKNFLNDSIEFNTFFAQSNKQKHFMFDLPSLVKYKLKKENVIISKHISHDTYNMPDLYYSYRRNLHKNKECNKRILSCIMLDNCN